MELVKAVDSRVPVAEQQKTKPGFPDLASATSHDRPFSWQTSRKQNRLFSGIDPMLAIMAVFAPFRSWSQAGCPNSTDSSALSRSPRMFEVTHGLAALASPCRATGLGRGSFLAPGFSHGKPSSRADAIVPVSQTGWLCRVRQNGEAFQFPVRRAPVQFLIRRVGRELP